VGEVRIGNADIGLADITITKEREEVVLFTKPFMDLGK
jgi:ABC-type amino acid transport substrate-binding protein